MQVSATLRPVCTDDKEFLFAAFCNERAHNFELLSATRDQKEQLLRMQYEAQQRGYRGQFPDANFDVVLIDGVPAGNLFAQRGPDDFTLIDIALLPEHRNRGIATKLIQDLIADACAAGRVLRAHVQKDNPARYLWQRLGFRIVGDDGVYLELEIPPDYST